jgi:hypothetical protein
VGGGLLVTEVDDAHAFLPVALVDRQQVTAREREHNIHSGGRDHCAASLPPGSGTIPSDSRRSERRRVGVLAGGAADTSLRARVPSTFRPSVHQRLETLQSTRTQKAAVSRQSVTRLPTTDVAHGHLSEHRRQRGGGRWGGCRRDARESRGLLSAAFRRPRVESSEHAAARPDECSLHRADERSVAGRLPLRSPGSTGTH